MTEYENNRALWYHNTYHYQLPFIPLRAKSLIMRQSYENPIIRQSYENPVSHFQCKCGSKLHVPYQGKTTKEKGQFPRHGDEVSTGLNIFFLICISIQQIFPWVFTQPAQKIFEKIILWTVFTDKVELPPGCRASTWRYFNFGHLKAPGNPWKDERLNRPWSYHLVLNQRPLD